MQRKTYGVLITAAAFGAVVLAGFAGVSCADEPMSSQYPNDRANHHPKSASVRENQAVVTRLGNNATAVSYWASMPDGRHVVTTVDTVVANDTAAEQHSIVRFAAILSDGQEQLISVPMALGEAAQVLRIRRIGSRIEMERVPDQSM